MTREAVWCFELCGSYLDGERKRDCECEGIPGT